MQISMQRQATGSRVPSNAIPHRRKTKNKQKKTATNVIYRMCQSLVILGDRSGTACDTKMFMRDTLRPYARSTLRQLWQATRRHIPEDYNPDVSTYAISVSVFWNVAAQRRPWASVRWETTGTALWTSRGGVATSISKTHSAKCTTW